MNEKKISIMEVADPCADCNVPGLDCGLCGLRICFNKLPTREQAIEKMAKGICSCDCDYFCGDCSCLDDEEACKRFIENAGYDKLAEAALNALLVDFPW